MTPPEQRPLAFYCVCGESYFLGAVAMLNSLRLVGHDEPLFACDYGLAAWQRDLLADHATLVECPDERPPHLAKTVAPLAHPAETMVLIDADMIVTRPLTELVERSRSGAVVAVRDRQQRYFPAWGGLLGLGETSPGPYVSSSLVFLPPGSGSEVAQLMEERRDRVDFERTFWRRNEREYPLLYADQDVLNGILRTRIPPGELVAVPQPYAAVPPFRGLRIVDEKRLRCAYRDGSEPFAVHQYVRKPWLEPTFHGVYSKLLSRLLVGPDIALRVPEERVPLRLRRGVRARASRARSSARDMLRWRFGDRLPEAIGTRIEAHRRRREARRA
jgi:hypothetical protein